MIVGLYFVYSYGVYYCISLCERPDRLDYVKKSRISINLDPFFAILVNFCHISHLIVLFLSFLLNIRYIASVMNGTVPCRGLLGR